MEVKDYIAAITLLLTLGNLLWTRHVSNQDKSKSAVDNLAGELNKQQSRLVHIETQLQALPSKESVHKLELAVAKVEGSMNTMAETIKPVTAGLARIEKWLIDNTVSLRKTR